MKKLDTTATILMILGTFILAFAFALFCYQVSDLNPTDERQLSAIDTYLKLSVLGGVLDVFGFIVKLFTSKY